MRVYQTTFRLLGGLLLLLCSLPVFAANGIEPDDRDLFALDNGPQQPSGPPELVWRVTNPFRLFTDPKLTELHRKTWEELQERGDDASILSAERLLGRRFPRGWAAEAFGATCWLPRAYRYGRCRKKNPYINPRHHVVTLDVRNSADPGGECTWTIAPRRKADRRYKVRSKTEPCDSSLEIKVPYPKGANVSVRLPDGQTLRQRVAVKDAFVVGIGDSFGSGEGNPDSPVKLSDERVNSYGVAPGERALDGYPTRAGTWSTFGDKGFLRSGARWLGQACHRSLYSHQTRVALQLAVEDPHRAITFVHFACSGAEITQGLFVKYKGNEWVPTPPRVPQISAVAEAQCGTATTPQTNYPVAYTIQGKLPILKDMVLKKCPRKRARRIDLLLVSIGGNDVGFSKIVSNAILADKSTLHKLSGWVGGVYGEAQAAPFISELKTRYQALNRAVHGLLHIPWNQSDRVVLTGYPPMAIVDDAGRVCPDGGAGMGVFPDFHLNARKVREAEDVAAKLNKAMRRAARAYQWSFVDKHRQRFVGHGLCANGDTGRDFDAMIDFTGASTDDVRLPRKLDGTWTPFPPSQYRPYASRGRWFRTPNDAYLTAHYHLTRTIGRKLLNAQKLRWFEVVLASTYSGAFHPTAEGHAAIADAVMPTARQVLKKYGK